MNIYDLELVNSLFFQKHLFDPNGLLDNLSLNEIIKGFESLANDSSVLKYADFYSSEEFSNELIFGGSGPYRIVNWIQGQSVYY